MTTLGVLCLALILTVSPASAQTTATTPADVFRQLLADRWVTREETLAELGFKGPLILGAPETRHEIYLPVPANVPLSGGEIKLNANYMRADGGRTTFVVSLDTYPVSSRPFPLEKGDASLVLGVDGTPRPSGFVRLGLDWGTALGADWICTDGRTAGNVLRIEPDSKFTFRFDGRSIHDLTTAWGALPLVPVILISSDNLTSGAYDSAWRLGVALERVGKRSRIRAFPKVGDNVDLDGVVIPPGLRSLPSFAALALGGSHVIRENAEVGALLALGSAGPFKADVVIADEAMTSALNHALDALRDEIQRNAPNAAVAFAEWRAQALNSTAGPTKSKEIQLAYMFGRPTIVVASDGGAQAAGLFGAYWNRMAVAPSMVVQAANEPDMDVSAVSLKYLGGKPGSFDVLAHADWSATFDIGAVAADGRLPGTLVLDL
ncbi:MAG: cellulose synthase, partial [Vicinamibacteria bacterium]